MGRFPKQRYFKSNLAEVKEQNLSNSLKRFQGFVDPDFGDPPFGHLIMDVGLADKQP